MCQAKSLPASLVNWKDYPDRTFVGTAVLGRAQILQAKVQRLEQVVKLKDAKLHALSLQLQHIEGGG